MRNQKLQDLLQTIQALHGLMESKLQMARFFATAEEEIRVHMVSVPVSRVKGVLRDISVDAENLARSRRIIFRLADNAVPETCFVNIDLGLLGVAIRLVVDNAVKYSHKQSHVTVRLDHHLGDVDILFVNRGLPLTTQDLEQVFQRGWRAKAAKMTTEGHGYGLWITRRIMEAMGGSVDVAPTDSSQHTQVRLTLPAVRA